jgi:hypothetical protein
MEKWGMAWFILHACWRRALSYGKLFTTLSIIIESQASKAYLNGKVRSV